MPPRRPLPRPRGPHAVPLRLGSLALVALVSVALSGCGVSTNARSDSASSSSRTPASPSGSSSAPSSPSPTVTATATVTATSVVVPTPAGEPTLPQSLLGPTEMPAAVPGTPWTGHADRAPGQRPFGPCQKFDLASIGARGLVERDFTGADHVVAGEQVAEFPDAKNTWRASRVLASWQQGCAGRVQAPQGARVHLGPIQPVAFSGGTGGWYQLTVTGPGHDSVTRTGYAVRNNRIALLTMSHPGPAVPSTSGQDPMAEAVAAAGAKLG